ncbi:sulfatase-like hydrolase/transferase [Helicobacter kayseriensis]|uniref:sulfatase-like hydrolase/transferase n=1 Tax=Helicobacter kayseriensis TaxID=2905877 RepID=UPI001E31BECB|nr:sulfatase-like hydrolase/transferase [Helicobacter kayseriensis]MCE3046645.1 sulfatase-like hydrolase/transferase [Helicobacter kayseriensis]MCE3048053.1 sulfatase-like hydrolase/transferase [Helicobacter kayseriensis]
MIGVALVCLVCATCVFRQGGATNKLPSPISLYGLFLAYGIDRVENPYSYRYELTKEIQISHAQYQHIVLVIDESIRFDYSPFLRLKHLGQWSVMDFGKATSYANSSAVSNIMLRKGVRYESIVEDFYHNALIWDYAKKAGYKTYLYDAQGGGRGHDYFDYVEEKMIDNNLSRVAIESDREIISSLQYLKTKQKTFTIIIKKGAHFPYNAFLSHYQFPLKFFVGYSAQTPQRVKYLKSVLYQSDRFCSELLKFQTQESTLIIYTSDHGQNLEDVAGLTHGSTQNPYSGEGLVPLVVLSNVQNMPISKHLQNNFNRSSHFNIFPTILEAMGYAPKKLGYLGYSGSLYGDIKEVGGFFYGIPFGYFGREPNFKKINADF